jgi:hypothetical protein
MEAIASAVIADDVHGNRILTRGYIDFNSASYARKTLRRCQILALTNTNGSRKGPA